VNFDGPVRVADTAGSGTATVTLSFDNWKGAKVAPTTHSLIVQPAKATVKIEPVADNLIGTLVHPDRTASVWTVSYSADGARLFATGYPSGVVQIFDPAGRKELRRIETPPGLRGSAEYALLTPDWKTLYVPVEVRKVKSFEKNGKQFRRIEQSGSIRVWDMTTGEERSPLKPPEGSAPVFARLSPDGNALVCVERPSADIDAEAVRPPDVTAIWDLTTRTRRKLADGDQIPAFAPDGKTLAIDHRDYEAKTSTVRLLDAATLKELARLDCPEKERFFSLGRFSPDGSRVVVSLGGKKGAPIEVWFLDGKTLAERGRFVIDGDPESYGWGSGAFTPDGTRYVILGAKGKVVVWDMQGKKVDRTFPLENSRWNLAISPDGKTLAVPWAPKSDNQERVRNPDPQDYPQPRVTLFDLAGKAQPRTLLARHGFVGAVAFSPDGKTLAFGSSGGVHLFDLTK
jgi:WD40 repeat protein